MSESMLVLAGDESASRGPFYVNPVGYVDGVTRTDPDPFVIRFRGRYYCYSTDERGVNVSVSDDLVVWRRLAPALVLENRAHYWAPCVTYHDGLFHLYVSSRPTGSSDPHEELLQIATSPTPEGPFTPGRRFFDTFSIDPHVVPDGAGGWVMFYSVNDASGFDDPYAGTSIVADRLLAPDRLEGRPRPVVLPSLDEEIYARDRFGDGRDWYTIEGASYFTRYGRAYLTYSGNAYVRPDYFIGYATAELVGAPHEHAWTKFPDAHTWHALVRRSDRVEGTGHNSIVRAPNLLDDWIVYHGRDAAEALDPEREQRRMRIDRLHYAGGELITEAPTADLRTPPARPTVFDILEADTVAPSWEVLGEGTYHPGPDGLSSDRYGAPALVHHHASDAYVAEVWFLAEANDTGSRVAFLVSWTDPRSFTEAIVDLTASTLSVRTYRDGLGAEVASAALDETRPGVWHRFSVQRDGDAAAIAVDDQPALTFVVPTGPGRVGVRSHRTAARFSAFTLTDHLLVEGVALAAPGSPFALVAPRPALVDNEGLVARGTDPVVLQAQRPHRATIRLDLELFAAVSRAEIALDPDAEGGIEICLDDRAVTVRTRTVDLVDTLTRTAPRTLTVEVELGDDLTSIRVGTWSVEVPTPRGADPALRVRLTAARLVRYESTDFPNPG